MRLDEACSEILKSKKYAFLCKTTIKRICAEEMEKYKKIDEAVKATKTRLHLIYGAYFNNQANEKANTALNSVNFENFLEIKNTSAEIMKHHASTYERLPYIEQFYSSIFEITGSVDSIIDIGCGFNPFSLPWIQNKNDSIKQYYASDIDKRTSALINCYFTKLGLPKNATDLDVVVETPKHKADIAFVFKLLPVIEKQSKGRGFTLLKDLRSKWIVVTYPLKSLGGKNKNMETNYAQAFEEGIDKNIFTFYKEKVGCELIYVLKSKPLSQNL